LLGLFKESQPNFQIVALRASTLCKVTHDYLLPIIS
jgi:hypothetical protein